MIQSCGGHNTKPCYTECSEFQDVFTRDILSKKCYINTCRINNSYIVMGILMYVRGCNRKFYNAYITPYCTDTNKRHEYSLTLNLLYNMCVCVIIPQTTAMMPVANRGRGGLGCSTPPPEMLKALQNRAKLNPIVKTVKNC